MVQKKQSPLKKRPLGKPYFQYLGEVVEQCGEHHFKIQWDFLFPPTEKEGQISKKTYR